MSRRSAPSAKAVSVARPGRRPASKRLIGLLLVGALLVAGALWMRQRTDPDRYRSFPEPRLEAWIAQHPDDADALYELGRKYRKEGQISDARQAFERVRRLEPGNARLLNDLGELIAGQGDYIAAQHLFEQAVQLRPDLPDPHRNLGDLAGIARNYTLAVRHYREALALRPDDVRALSSLGSAYADALNRGEAEAAFRKAVALEPQNPDTYQRWGLALFKLRDYAGARAALQQAVRWGPTDPQSHLLLGLTYAQQLRSAGDEQQALAQLNQAEALGYAGGEDDYGRGLVYLRRKEYPKAIAALETAVRQEGGGDDARYRLARACLAAGQTVRGQAVLRQFERRRQTQSAVDRLYYQLSTRPDDTAVRRRLARLCLDTGRYRAAIQQYRLLTNAGAADAEVLQGLERAASAVGDTRLAAQARASLLTRH